MVMNEAEINANTLARETMNELCKHDEPLFASYHAKCQVVQAFAATILKATTNQPDAVATPQVVSSVDAFAEEAIAQFSSWWAMNQEVTKLDAYNELKLIIMATLTNARGQLREVWYKELREKEQRIMQLERSLENIREFAVEIGESEHSYVAQQCAKNIRRECSEILVPGKSIKQKGGA